ncbi:MAG: hypothetical protein QN157_08910 [Armatimonadota bacterium]|nr:hypothetical protein [Armatimonadota bacterium]
MPDHPRPGRGRPRQAKKPLVAPRRSPAPWAAAAVALVAVVGVLIALGSRPGARLPRVGDHWHAPFRIVLCGERTPPLPPSPGNVHTHGDDVIHIHPATPEEAGRNATLGAFLRSVGMEVTNTSLTVRGKTYTTGDRCPDGRTGRVAVLVNGNPIDDAHAYVPKDGDQIEFRFGP